MNRTKTVPSTNPEHSPENRSRQTAADPVLSSRKKIGMIVAVEIHAVLEKYGSSAYESSSSSFESFEKNGYRLYRHSNEKRELLVVYSGAGQIAASSATQFLISEFHVETIVNFGVVGGLTEEMSTTSTCLVEKVVHYDFDTSEVDNIPVGKYTDQEDLYLYPDSRLLALAKKEALCSGLGDLPLVTCASGDKFIGSAERKRELHEQFQADICEMEAAGIVITSNRNGVPCLLLKTVSDSIHGGAEEFKSTIRRTAGMCLEIMDRLIDLL